MKPIFRKLSLLLLIPCLLAGCESGAVPVEEPELPNDAEGTSVTVSVQLPSRFPEELYGPNSSIELFRGNTETGMEGYSYSWDGETVWDGVPGSDLIPAAPSTEFTVDLPFVESLTFSTTAKEYYDSGMKISATYHYRDGRTVYESFDGLELGTILLDSRGKIIAQEFPYAFEGNSGWYADVTAEYKGVADLSVQALDVRMNSLYREFQVITGGILATSSQEGYTVTVTDPDGTKSITHYTGNELSEYWWGYEKAEYAILSGDFFNGVQVLNDCGEASPNFPESSARPLMKIYHTYSPGVELGPGYYQVDTTAQKAFTFFLSPESSRLLPGGKRWFAVTNKSPKRGDSLLCVSDFSGDTAVLCRDGTALLKGDLSDFTVCFIPPEENHVLCLKGSGKDLALIRYRWGTLTAMGKDLEYTVTEKDLSILPFDPEDRPAIVR